MAVLSLLQLQQEAALQSNLSSIPIHDVDSNPAIEGGHAHCSHGSDRLRQKHVHQECYWDPEYQNWTWTLFGFVPTNQAIDIYEADMTGRNRESRVIRDDHKWQINRACGYTWI